MHRVTLGAEPLPRFQDFFEIPVRVFESSRIYRKEFRFEIEGYDVQRMNFKIALSAFEKLPEFFRILRKTFEENLADVRAEFVKRNKRVLVILPQEKACG